MINYNTTIYIQISLFRKCLKLNIYQYNRVVYLFLTTEKTNKKTNKVFPLREISN